MFNDKITVVETNFSHAVSLTQISLFLNQFIMLYKDRTTMRLYLVEDPVENIESDYCVIQLYFNDHLFGPNNDSKILDYENLSKKTVELLNELFSLDQDNNGSILRECIKQNNIKFD